MNRTPRAALCLVIVLSACKVERTPPRFLTQRTPASAERDEAIGELRARLAVVGQALARGEPEVLAEALAPADEVFIVLPDEAGRIVPADGVSAAVAGLAAADSGDARLSLEEVRVALAPRGDAAWFSGRVRRTSSSDGAELGPPWSMTGVLLRSEGVWRLTQLHTSAVAATLPEVSPEPSPEVAEAPEDE